MRPKDRGLSDEDWAMRTEDRGLRTEDKVSGFRFQVSASEDRGLKTEDKRVRG